jgi:hypothetical protein
MLFSVIFELTNFNLRAIKVCSEPFERGGGVFEQKIILEGMRIN